MKRHPASPSGYFADILPHLLPFGCQEDKIWHVGGSGEGPGHTEPSMHPACWQPCMDGYGDTDMDVEEIAERGCLQLMLAAAGTSLQPCLCLPAPGTFWPALQAGPSMPQQLLCSSCRLRSRAAAQPWSCSPPARSSQRAHFGGWWGADLQPGSLIDREASLALIKAPGPPL